MRYGNVESESLDILTSRQVYPSHNCRPQPKYLPQRQGLGSLEKRPIGVETSSTDERRVFVPEVPRPKSNGSSSNILARKEVTHTYALVLNSTYPQIYPHMLWIDRC